jgi:hypothetical protein
MVNIPFWITRHGSACMNSIGESRRKDKEVIAKMKRKIDQSTVAIIIGVTSILINLIFSGKDLLRNIRWLLSYLV